ncbi:hypothetical protein C8Q74DRAFT_1291439 [Fomes fomentarius]|nr:hypothetical protein C8Q74DRAFT_1291439 [Fomes fomentarius]
MSQNNSSQDEFADLPDIVDFGAIPLINLTNPPSDDTRANPADEFVEYDDYNDVDCFTGIDLDTIVELGPVQPPFQAVGGVEPEAPTGLPQSQPQPNEEVRTQSAASASSQYEYEELEPSIWDVVNVIEQNAMEQDVPPSMQGDHLETSALTPDLVATHVSGSFPSQSRASSISYLSSQLSGRSSIKRKRSDIESDPSAIKKSKGKAKARRDPHASIRRVLADLEESISCTICFNTFSEPHVGSPCGHSFCGECIVNWMKKNLQNVPRCPICRTALTQGSLIIPNFTLKHNIEKYIVALTETGVMDWQPKGRLYTQWAERNAHWPQAMKDLQDLRGRRWDLRVPSQSLEERESTGEESSSDDDDDDDIF